MRAENECDRVCQKRVASSSGREEGGVGDWEHIWLDRTSLIRIEPSLFPAERDIQRQNDHYDHNINKS